MARADLTAAPSPGRRSCPFDLSHGRASLSRSHVSAVFGSAVFSSAVARQCLGAILSQSPRHHRGAICSRRAGFGGPRHGQAAAGAARSVRRRREPPGRERHDRDRCGCPGGARRHHAADHVGLDRGQSQHLSQAALRRAHGSRCCRLDLPDRRLRVGGQPVGTGKDGAGGLSRSRARRTVASLTARPASATRFTLPANCSRRAPESS